MKKCLCLLLALAALLSFTACSGGGEIEVPTGMKLISDPKINNWYFFVPDGWSESVSGGMCMAFVPTSSHVSISFADYSSGGYTSVRDYWDANYDHLSSVFDNFELIEDGEATELADYAALRFVYTARYNGRDLKFMQVLLYANGVIYAFTYSADAGVYDTYMVYIDRVLEEFRFRGQKN